MKKIKIILGILLIVPIVLGALLFANPNPTFEVDHPVLALAFYVIGIPIIVLNAWAWAAPQIIKTILGTKE